jgi:hypothetical protein
LREADAHLEGLRENSRESISERTLVDFPFFGWCRQLRTGVVEVKLAILAYH